jgi:hypothetical protein
MTVLLVLGLIFATWRVTRLLVVDEFPPVKALREWTVRTFGVVDGEGKLVGGRGPGWGAKAAEATVGTHLARAAAALVRGVAHAVAYVWTCPWCMSVWAGAALVAAADWRLSVPYPWLIVAAGSALSGAMSWVEAEHDQRWELRQREVERGR